MSKTTLSDELYFDMKTSFKIFVLSMFLLSTLGVNAGSCDCSKNHIKSCHNSEMKKNSMKHNHTSMMSSLKSLIDHNCCDSSTAPNKISHHNHSKQLLTDCCHSEKPNTKQANFVLSSGLNEIPVPVWERNFLPGIASINLKLESFLFNNRTESISSTIKQNFKLPVYIFNNQLLI